MTTSMLACGKANASGRLRSAISAVPSTARRYTTAHGDVKHSTKSEDAALQRELFVNVLNANATKRDAKQYLARFRPTRKTTSDQEMKAESDARHRRDQYRLDQSGVNLGGLYTPARAIAESPQFTHHRTEHGKRQVMEQSQPHVALVCLKTPELIDDVTLNGLAVTLSQLVKLDMRIVLVLDTDMDTVALGRDDAVKPGVRDIRTRLAQQALRINDCLEQHNTSGGRFIPGAIEQIDDVDSPSDNPEELKVALPRLILEPLERGVVPIVPSLAYSPTGQLLRVSSISVMTALTRSLAGCDQVESGSGADGPTRTASVDRIIVLDSNGGIPSKVRGNGAHVFINLEQEFEGIENEISDYAAAARDDPLNAANSTIYEQHRQNLQMVQQCLRILPSASSALIVTPHEAASSADPRRSRETTTGAGTRPMRNSLIHNLLTNKPMVSSSLPSARLSSHNSGNGSPTLQRIAAPTLIKRGMPVKIVPSVDRIQGWQLPAHGISPLQIENDARIEFPKLLHLIQDSFRRKLNVQHYLSRIENRIAGVIVTGEYEGGAILTWEMPPGTNDPARLVPYLDKFAVLQSSQGSSGVADIVFQAMVRTCFPQGVCWRSRQDNPVNKWYFERAAGSWQIPHSNWTMFWTGEGVVENEQRFSDYVAVCSSVKPSWADGKKPD